MNKCLRLFGLVSPSAAHCQRVSPPSVTANLLSVALEEPGLGKRAKVSSALAPSEFRRSTFSLLCLGNTQQYLPVSVACSKIGSKGALKGRKAFDVVRTEVFSKALLLDIIACNSFFPFAS